MKVTKLNLTGGNNKESRRALDFYPTPPEVTIALLNFLKMKPCRIWEPASGNGMMSKVLESAGHSVYSSDISDTGYGDTGVDFLGADHREVDAIITNPPFNLSAEFIAKALGMANTVAMVLKSQYWHAKKRVALFNQTPPTYVLPLTWRPDFAQGERGGSPTLEVVWTVWIRGDYRRIYQPLTRPTGQTNLFE